MSDYRDPAEATVPRADYDRVVAENVRLRAELDEAKNIAPELARIVPSDVSPAKLFYYATLAVFAGNSVLHLVLRIAAALVQ